MEATEAQASQGVTSHSLFKDAADLVGVPDRVRIAFRSELGGPDGVTLAWVHFWGLENRWV
eukprot:5414913-Amphidinium_carterae.2